MVWADACTDLLAGWAGIESLPFSQVHGHSSPHRWSDDAWWDHVPKALLESADANPAARHTRFTWQDGHQILGIDPGYGSEAAAVPLVPLVISAA